jgi:dTDP-glucose pyrophosphorylase
MNGQTEEEKECLRRWKKWFDTGSKDELTRAIETIRRIVTMASKAGDKKHVKARSPYLEYAENKMEERFGYWWIPF